jgi:PTH1 family peptidyl-tRNA hydrolase
VIAVIGLGNPGKEYEGTRHNMGFEVIDALIERSRIPQAGSKFHAVYGTGIIGGQKAVLAKPLTYMNLSGTTVRELCDFYKIESSDLIIVSDDIDLAPGQIRIRKTGSAGGHNGLKDIIQKMGTQDFIRVRVGTGAKPQNWDLADYVLGHFSKSDRKLIDEAVIRAAEAVECIASEGTDAAMNKYNVRPARKRAEHRNIQADTAKNGTVQADTAKNDTVQADTAKNGTVQAESAECTSSPDQTAESK